MNKHEVLEVLAILSSVWPEKQLPETTKQAYFWTLADEPADAVREATRRLIKTAKYFPKPSELIAEANRVADEQIRAGDLVLPPKPSPISLYERIEAHRRIISGFERLRIKNKHEPRIVIELNREAEEDGIPGIDVGELPDWMQARIVALTKGEAA